MNSCTEGSPAVEVDMRTSFTVWGNRWENKQRIEQLFRQRKELDYWDILKALRLDLLLIVEVCKELEEEGKIEVVP